MNKINERSMQRQRLKTHARVFFIEDKITTTKPEEIKIVKELTNVAEANRKKN